MGTGKVSEKIISLLLIVIIAALTVGVKPVATSAKTTKPILKLSKKSIKISKDTDITLTSNKKNAQITFTVKDPNIAAVTQKSQKGKKTVFTVSPKQKGSTSVTFRSAKKTVTLKVKVTKTSQDTIKNGFNARMVVDSVNNSWVVHVMVYNHTGLDTYFADWSQIHGNLDYDGHWFDPAAQGASQFGAQYALVRSEEEKQIDYFNAPVYGQRLDSRYAVMSFQNRASVTMTVYFGSVNAKNAYTVTVDQNGVTSFVKQ